MYNRLLHLDGLIIDLNSGVQVSIRKIRKLFDNKCTLAVDYSPEESLTTPTTQLGMGLETIVVL